MNHSKDNGSPIEAALTVRSNGLAQEPPTRGAHVLVAGGAGYIGCVLVEKLIQRGYRIRLVDRLYWGEGPLEHLRDEIELVCADVREMPDGVFDGIDGVINLSGLSNDPTAEYDPEANWQMNAVATETMGRKCVEHGIERLVFASSCSLYDGLPPGMWDETAPIDPRGAYATSKHYAEQALLGLMDDGLTPVILRNGTVYGWSPRMRFDLVVNTFVKDALLPGRLALQRGGWMWGAAWHGGGWMWRPLVDVSDVADAMIAVLEAPAEKVEGEVFNVLHSNYQIRELAMLVAGSVQLTGKEVALIETPAPPLNRNYECSNAKLSATLGFTPSRSVVEAVADLLKRIDLEDRTMLSDPRYYNIRWIELLNELKPRLETFSSVT